MATTLHTHRATQRDQAGPHATWLITIAAAALTLVIGFSAVDIQRQRAATIDQAQSGAPAAAMLDGRGKWGGYMK
jgi:hypothetical protein